MDKFVTELRIQFYRGKNEAVLLDELIYEHKKLGTIVVPRGFVTDFASVPNFLQSLVQSVGILRDAAVLHDFLYKNHGFFRWSGNEIIIVKLSKSKCDLIFFQAMKSTNVPAIKRQMAYAGVAVGGFNSWRKCGKKLKGMTA